MNTLQSELEGVTPQQSTVTIERLQHDLQKVVPENVSVVLGRSTDTRTFQRNTVCLVPRVLETCPNITELVEAFRKRLKGMKVPYSIEQLVTVGVSCVCSVGYTVNHHTVKLLQPAQVLNIWQHIETLRVSSSYELSTWLNESVNRRSQDGYIISFHGDEGVPSFKPESSATVLNVQACKEVHVLDYHELPVLHDSATTVARAATVDSTFLSTARVYNGTSPLYSTIFPSFPQS